MGLPGSAHIYSAIDYVLRVDGNDLDILAADPQGKSRMCRAIVACTGGTLVVTRHDDAVVILPAGPDGFIWDIQVKFIAAASTATGVVVLY